MNLRTCVGCEIIYDKKRFLTRPDFQVIFDIVTVDKDTGQILCESNSQRGLYDALLDHFEVLADRDYCNLMYLLDPNTYNTLTLFWAKNEKGVSDSLSKIEEIKDELKVQDLLELNRFLVKIFQHPEQPIIS